PSIPADVLVTMQDETTKLIASGIAEQAKNVGDRAPAFNLENSSGELLAMQDFLQQGVLVVNFYRGAWCPYCNLELKAWNNAMPALNKLGANLVSITPNMKEKSSALLQENPFDFDILWDCDNQVAKNYGLVFTLSETLRSIYKGFDINLPEFDGNVRYELPLPATYVIDADGSILHAFVDADYTKRMDPQDILKLL
ncbi:MAG: peroxiredoxin-like family protein, partial [Mariprofundaceae bacterium]|nr:peroxiredoxin-like family protein [Mariprofundaceae bacterium]